MIFRKLALATLQVASLLPVLAMAQESGETGGVCFMLYSMADNNLEFSLRRDLVELVISPAISDETLTTWVYFDQRNLQNTPPGEVINTSLPLLYNNDGSDLPPEKFEGSRYLTYDHEMDKLIVDTVLEGEINGDQPQTVYDYMMYALADCVDKGASEYFLIFSSHGAGFQGYGGDENVPEEEEVAVEAEEQGPQDNPDSDMGRRKLLQRNQKIVDAIKLALNNTDGAPDKLDVLGFDACLMSALGVADEYRDVTKYLLASEAVVPGHGLAYNRLDTASSALDMAVNFWFHFINETQALTQFGLPDVHRTPKTMALVDMEAFNVFHEAWEMLSAEMLGLLMAGDDPEFFAALSRARDDTIAFDIVSEERDAVDIGWFLTNLETICNVDPGSALYDRLNETMAAYDEQFLLRGVGNGTCPATGMHVFWPPKSEYKLKPDLYELFLFESYYNDDAPMWSEFLKAFLNSTSPTVASGTSVCLASLVSSLEPENEGQLLLNPSIEYDNDAGYSIVSSEITVETDLVYVDFGLNLTHLLGERRLQEKLMKSKSSNDNGSRRGRGRGRRLGHEHRRTQELGDYYYLYGGDVAVEYEGPAVAAAWDYTFYYILTPDGYENIYVYDYGNGQKSFPVCYFSPDNERSSEDFVEIISVDEAKTNLGCVEGEMFFTITEDMEVSFSLFTPSASGPPSEVPPSAGGQITPIVYIDVSLGGNSFNEIVGGYNETIVEWSFDNGLSLEMVPDYWNLEFYGAKYGVMGMYAFDFDAAEPVVDSKLFSYFFQTPPAAVEKSGGVRGLKKEGV